MVITFYFNIQVIPGLLSLASESDEKSPDLFAYVSIDEMKEQEKLPNTLHGQIRKCNLTESRLVGGVTLAEVHVLL